MENLLLNIIVLSYAGAGIVNSVAYWPTIKDLYHQKPSANPSSYLLWTLTSLIALFYGIFIIPDTLFIVISTINFLACGTILSLSLILRKNRI